MDKFSWFMVGYVIVATILFVVWIGMGIYLIVNPEYGPEYIEPLCVPQHHFGEWVHKGEDVFAVRMTDEEYAYYCVEMR